MLQPRRSTGLAYLIAVLGTVLVVVARLTVDGALGTVLASVTFIVAVLVAAGVGGWKPGLTVTALSVLAVDFLFIRPYYSFKIPTTASFLRYFAYAFVGAALSLLCEGLHRAWRRIEERQRKLEEEVAERRKAEQREKAQAERLRVTLASIGDAVITTDSQGRVGYLNGVAESLTGWRLEEARGKDLETVFQIVNETSRMRVESPVAKVLRTGTVVGLTSHTVLIAKDGTERPIDDSAAPIRDPSDSPCGVVMIFRDVTDQRRRNQRLQLLWDTAAVLLSATDQHALGQFFEKIGPPLQVDAYFNFMVDESGSAVRLESYGGIAPETVVNLVEVDFPRELWGDEIGLEQNSPGSESNPHNRLAQSAGLTTYISNPLRIGDRLLGTLSFGSRTKNEFPADTFEFLRTITHYATLAHERIRLLRELRESDRRKDQFLATLAHELRNPLAPISNALELWPKFENDREEMRQMHEMMQRQMQQVVRLIDDLLDVARITRGTIPLRMQPVNLAIVLERAVEAIRPFIEACRHRLTINAPTEMIFVNGDITRLVQVYANILHNAAKYTGHDGSISVSVNREEGHAVVGIRDNGPGIPQPMLAEVFEMFTQVDRTLERSHGGLGIGLTLVKNLVLLHSGNIEARSEGLGKGSEFIVRLPIVSTPREEPLSEVNGSSERIASVVPRHKVLVVDDVQASAKTLGMMLTAIGQDVIVKVNGQSAIDAVASDHPQVAFIDIAMPGMNGYDVARHLKRQPDLHGLVLVALTGYGQVEDRKQAFEAGFDHHLVKPASIDALRKLLLTIPS